VRGGSHYSILSVYEAAYTGVRSAASALIIV
jgi:hypothetical protein